MALPAEPKVSVLMAVRDSAATLAPTLCSLLAQSYRRWELVLLDDGSRDGTAALARSFPDARIRVLQDGLRRGLAGRLNQAVALADGDLLARVDGDDILYPERFAEQVAYLREHPQVDLLGTGMLVFTSSGSVRGQWQGPTTHEAICRRAFHGLPLAHPTWMGRRAWFRAWPYDEHNRRSEDQDLLLRAHRNSHFAALPHLLVAYRQDRISLAKSLRGRYDFCRGLPAAARRNRAWGAAAGGLLAHLAKFGLDALAVGTGLEQRLLRHRFRAAPPAELRRWQALWAAVTAEHDG